MADLQLRSGTEMHAHDATGKLAQTNQRGIATSDVYLKENKLKPWLKIAAIDL